MDQLATKSKSHLPAVVAAPLAQIPLPALPSPKENKKQFLYRQYLEMKNKQKLSLVSAFPNKARFLSQTNVAPLTAAAINSNAPLLYKGTSMEIVQSNSPAVGKVKNIQNREFLNKINNVKPPKTVAKKQKKEVTAFAAQSPKTIKKRKILIDEQDLLPSLK